MTMKNIVMKDKGTESKISIGEIEEINEIPALILIKFKGGQTIILLKDKNNKSQRFGYSVERALNLKYIHLKTTLA